MQRAAMLSPASQGEVGRQSAPPREVAGSGRRGRGGSKAGSMRALHYAMGHTHFPASSRRPSTAQRYRRRRRCGCVPAHSGMGGATGVARAAPHARRRDPLQARLAGSAALRAIAPSGCTLPWQESQLLTRRLQSPHPTRRLTRAPTRPLRRPHPAAMPGAWPVSERQVPGRIHATPVGRGKAGDAAVEEAIHVQLVGDVLDL